MLIWEWSAGLENGSVHLCILPWSPQQLAGIITSGRATSLGKELERNRSVTHSNPVLGAPCLVSPYPWPCFGVAAPGSRVPCGWVS